MYQKAAPLSARVNEA